MNIIFIHPSINNYNLDRRGYCFTIRKMTHIHKNINIYQHPYNSFEITRSHSQEDCINFFNKYEYFISYDPLTFLVIIAALCGCIPVVIKVDGMSKDEWIKTTAVTDYLNYTGEKTLYGIAYGYEDIEYAKQTLHLVKDQWNRIVNFTKDKYVKTFIDDINNWDNNKNTLESNFFK